MHASEQQIHLRLSVSDNGVGVAKDVIPKLFRNFSQADAATTRKFGQCYAVRERAIMNQFLRRCFAVCSILATRWKWIRSFTTATVMRIC